MSLDVTCDGFYLFFLVPFFLLTPVQAEGSQAVLLPPGSGSARASYPERVQGSAAGPRF